MRCRDVFGEAGHFESFWQQVHSKLTYLHGSPVLSPAARRGGMPATEDALSFLTTCSDDHFLDVVEFVFPIAVDLNINERESLVDDFNEFLQVDDLPYSVTPFVWSKGTSMLYGREHETMSISAYPLVIRKDSELIHFSAIMPTLLLLSDTRFAAANQELLAALQDYRHGDYGDCLTKCGSAFESALKVICDIRNWPYQGTDTVAPLLKTVIARAGLDSFLEQPLMVIATLRNRLSTAHGSGTAVRHVSRAKAEYTLNATASAVLLLIREAA